RSTMRRRSTSGMTNTKPGPRSGISRPSRNTTQRSYSRTTVMPAIAPTAAATSRTTRRNTNVPMGIARTRVSSGPVTETTRHSAERGSRLPRPVQASLPDEGLDLRRALGGVLLAELDQAPEVVRLEHHERDQVVRARLLRAEAARQEPERERQV